MAYLKISNPGVADYRGFTLLGVSTTRNSGFAGTIGQFGSGSKLSLALLLRNGIEPTVICGNLRLTFFIKTEMVKGQTFRRVCVKFQGKDIDGATKNTTEDLGFTLEWGVQDWNRLSMAIREIVSNAIDGSICAGGSHKSVRIEVVDEIRAKNGYTAVYLPYNEAVQKMHAELPLMFLHLGNSSLLESKCLPKRYPNEKKVLIYKKGVLVSYLEGESLFDYNLGNELTLDESRNAQEWDVRYAVARALRDETPSTLVTVIKGVMENPQCWEALLDSSSLRTSSYEDAHVLERRKKNFQEAWGRIAGPKGVVSSGIAALASFVLEKGFTPYTVEGSWGKVLESYEVPSEANVLTCNELEGKVLSEPTETMVKCTKQVWQLFESFNLTNGKPCPQVKGFTSVLDGGAQTWGYYLPGGSVIYLHTSLGEGKLLFKVALEEIVHYTTGSDDKSRDIQDFLFNLVTEMAF